MFPDRTCPKCHRPIPVLATECMHCHAPLPAEEQRYHVVRAGAPAADGDLPASVRTLEETARVWYCKIGGQTVGPCLAADIRDAFSKGQIDGQASVGVQGYKAWYPIRSLPQFSHLVTGVRPVPTARPGAAAAPAPLPTLGAPRPGAPTGSPLGGPGPSAPRPMPAAPGAQGLVPSPNSQREDETLVVPPLPPPALLGIGDHTGEVADPRVRAYQAEVRSLKRLVWFFGLLAAGLALAAAVLLGLLVSG